MKRTRIGLASLLLACTVIASLVGCGTTIKAKNLMDDIVPNEASVLDDLGSQNEDATDFAIRLFKASEESGKNTLISPLSVMSALAMTANGADGETRAQMEDVLGMTVEDLNLYLHTYMMSLLQNEQCKLSLANSIWFTEDEKFTVNQDFLQTNADYYGADIYEAPFNEQTCQDINTWVKEKTDGMIPKILDKIPGDAVMYLVNALAFDAEWAEIYKEDQVRNDIFTKEDGAEQSVDFMYCEESLYLEDENATGFMKHYKDGEYAFVAMLPREGMSVSEYIASLDGASMSKMLANPQQAIVHTAIPKFETEYDTEMSAVLKNMGMPRAFDLDNAEFEDLGTVVNGNIAIGRVLHKTFIAVDEKGTEAGAATVVEMLETTALRDPQEPKQVYLDRPFVYMLVDCENNLPFFIGTMMDVEN